MECKSYLRFQLFCLEPFKEIIRLGIFRSNKLCHDHSMNGTIIPGEFKEIFQHMEHKNQTKSKSHINCKVS